MSENVTKIFWMKGGSARLEDFPWTDLEKPPVHIEASSFTEEELAGRISEINQISSPVLIFDADTEEQLNRVETTITRKLVDAVVFLVLIPPTLLEAADRKLGRKHLYLFQKPLRPVEFLVLLEKILLVNYYRRKIVELSKDEQEWLTRVEKVFEFSRQELLDREKTTDAFVKLVEYEEKLLSEQKRITQALMALQDFRDKERLEWERERKARESLEDLQNRELISKDKTMKAQENLLDFVRDEKIALRDLLRKFRESGSLSKDEILRLFDSHDQLLDSMQKMSR